MRYLLFAVLLFSLAGLSNGDELKIDPGNAAVVLSADASVTERFAASELVRYVKLMTGREMPVVGAAAQTGKHLFLIGRGASGNGYSSEFDPAAAGKGPDSFIIDAGGQRTALIGGSDRGTLYSVYELLEQQGCRWFFPGRLGEVVPAKSELILQSGKRKFVPDFIQRSVEAGQTEGIDFEETIDWAAKNRLNFMFSMRLPFVKKFLPREKWDAWDKRGGLQEWQWICHNFDFMIPSSKYFGEHPEYYALYKGKRLPSGSPGRPGYGGGNICTANQDVIKICAGFANEWFDKNPRGIVVPVWPNDGAITWCECDECRKLKGINFMSGKRGSMSRRMITFANAVAKAVADKHPDRFILCPAYSNYVMPEDVPVEKNVLVQYCLHGDYAHGLDRSKENAEEKEWIDAWAAKAAGHMGVWEYFLLGDHYSAPTENAAMLPVTYRARDTINYLKKIGVNWYFTQTSPKYWKHNIFPYYVTARYIWQADRNFDQFADDFFNNMYGDAGQDVKNFYLQIENSVSASDWHPSVYSDVAVPSPKVFTPALLAQCAASLDRAAKKNLTPVQRERLKLVENTFSNIKSNIGTQSALGIDPRAQWRIERRQDAYVINPDGRELSDLDMTRLVTNAIDSGNFNKDFERLIFRARKRQVPVITLENDAVKVGTIPELGGRIIRFSDKQTGKNFLKEPADGNSLKSIGEAYFNYGGYEEYIGKAFAGPGWENAFTWKKVSAADGDSLVMDADIGDFHLRRTLMLKKGMDRALEVESVLTNKTAVPLTTQLRVHPALSLGGDSGEFKVVILGADGKLKSSTVNAEHDRFTHDNGGVWAVIDTAKNCGIANVFPAGSAWIYLCKTAPDTFNMELLGKEQLLKPGESITFKHKYQILKNGMEEFNSLIKGQKR
jgi:hypothetical protein